MRPQFRVPEQLKQPPQNILLLIQRFLEWVKEKQHPHFFQTAENETWESLLSSCESAENPYALWTSLLMGILTNERVATAYQLRALLSVLFVRYGVIRVTNPGDYAYKMHVNLDKFDAFSLSSRALCLELVVQFTRACEEAYQYPDKHQHHHLQACSHEVLAFLAYHLSDEEKRLLYDACPVWIDTEGNVYVPEHAPPVLQRIVIKKIQMLMQNGDRLNQAALRVSAAQYWQAFLDPLMRYADDASLSEDIKEDLEGHIRFLFARDADTIEYLFSEGMVHVSMIEKLWHILKGFAYIDVRDMLVWMLVEHIQADDSVPTHFLDTIRSMYTACQWLPEAWCETQRAVTEKFLLQQALLAEQLKEGEQNRQKREQSRERSIQHLLETLYVNKG